MRFLTFLFIAMGFFATGCQTSRDVSLAYRDATYGGDHYKPSNETAVVFLIDGLSTEILRTSLRNGNVPQIANAFTLSTKARFNIGRAQFPSLTFPNLTSILLTAPISDHPITGNRIVVDNHVVNFENPSNWNELAALTQRKTIFTKLAANSESSVSYAYAFAGGATAYQDKTIDAGFSYAQDDYASVDLATIESLRHLLTETQVSKWPRFIFVHLIGVDATAHRYGPSSPLVQTYLHELDANLGAIFSLLDHPDGLSAMSRKVDYALTADHGFQTTTSYAPLAEVIEHLNRKIRFVADNRVGSLYLDEPMNDAARVQFAKDLTQVENVEWAAVKSETAIDLIHRVGERTRRARITYAYVNCANGDVGANFQWLDEAADDEGEKTFTCLGDFDLNTDPNDSGYIIPTLTEYFASPTSPDIVFTPNDHSDFASGHAGNHGGFTADEIFVPVLAKGFTLPRGIHPTYKLLDFMGVK